MTEGFWGGTAAAGRGASVVNRNGGNNGGDMVAVLVNEENKNAR